MGSNRNCSVASSPIIRKSSSLKGTQEAASRVLGDRTMSGVGRVGRNRDITWDSATARGGYNDL